MACGCIQNPIITPSTSCNVEYAVCAGLPTSIDLTPLCDNAVFNVVITTAPLKGTATIQANNLVYLPNANSTGDDSVIYQIECGATTITCTATFHITESLGTGEKRIYVSAGGSKCEIGGVEFGDPKYYWYGFNDQIRLDEDRSTIADEGIYIIVEEYDPVNNPNPTGGIIYVKVCCGDCDDCCKIKEFRWNPPIYTGGDCNVPDCSPYNCTRFNANTGNCEYQCGDCENCCDDGNGGFNCNECCLDTQCPDGQTCVNGDCTCPNGTLPDENGNCIDCVNNSQCPCGKCVNGKCVDCVDNCPDDTVLDCFDGSTEEMPCPCVECLEDVQCDGMLECIDKECQCPPELCVNAVTGECEVCPDCVVHADCPHCQQCVAGACVQTSCPTDTDDNGNLNYIPNPNITSDSDPCCVMNPCVTNDYKFELIRNIVDKSTLFTFLGESTGGVLLFNAKVPVGQFSTALLSNVGSYVTINYTKFVGDFIQVGLEDSGFYEGTPNTRLYVDTNIIGNGFVLRIDYNGFVYEEEFFWNGTDIERRLIGTNCANVYYLQWYLDGVIQSTSDLSDITVDITACPQLLGQYNKADFDMFVINCDGDECLLSGTVTINTDDLVDCVQDWEDTVTCRPCAGACDTPTLINIDTITNEDGSFTYHASVFNDVGAIYFDCQPPSNDEWVAGGESIKDTYSGIADNCGTLPNDGFSGFNCNNSTDWECNAGVPTKPCGWIVNDLDILHLNGSNITVKTKDGITSTKPFICFGVNTECGYICKCIDLVVPTTCLDAVPSFTAPIGDCGFNSVTVQKPKINIGQITEWTVNVANTTPGKYTGNAEKAAFAIIDQTKEVVVNYGNIAVSFDGEVCTQNVAQQYVIDPCSVATCNVIVNAKYAVDVNALYITATVIGEQGAYQLLISGPNGVEVTQIINIPPSGVFEDTYQVSTFGTYTITVTKTADMNCNANTTVQIPNIQSKTYDVDCGLGCLERTDGSGEFTTVTACQSALNERCQDCEIITDGPSIEDNTGNGNNPDTNFNYSYSPTVSTTGTSNKSISYGTSMTDSTYLSKEVIDNLTARNNVQGVGYGLKKSNGSYTGEKAVIVYVDRKRPLNGLTKKDLIPKEINGYLTDVVERPIAHAWGYCNHGPCCATGPCNLDECPSHTGDFQLVQGGQSIFYGSSRGTLGITAIDNVSKAVVGVSNNHVLGNFHEGDYLGCGSQSQPSSLVYHTNSTSFGSFTGGQKIGQVLRSVPFQSGGVTETDAACFNIDVNKATTGTIDLGNINHVWATESEVNDLIGKNIYKSGGTTGTINPDQGLGPITTITSVQVTAPVSLCGGGGVSNFTDCIVAEIPEGTYDPMGLPGDSGSPIFAKINGVIKLIGLLFAGDCKVPANSPAYNFIYITPIWKVAQSLNISYWDGSVVVPSSGEANININGVCYQLNGTTSDPITHNLYTTSC